MKIIAIDKDGNEKGNHRVVSKDYWEMLQNKFGRNLRWKLIKEKDERKKRRDSGDSVKNDQ